MARSQLRSMVRSEAVIVASLGTVLGVGLALLFGWALVGAMGHLGVTHLVVPVGRITALAAAASAAGLLAGALAAPRAARLRVLTTGGSVGQV